MAVADGSALLRICSRRPKARRCRRPWRWTGYSRPSAGRAGGWSAQRTGRSQISEWAHPRGGSRRRTDYTRRVLDRIAVKRPDPPGCEAQGGPGLAMTAQSVSVHHDRDDPSKKAAFEPVKLQLWLAIAAYPPGRLYRAVSPDENLNAALRRAMAARDQARRLPGHRAQGRCPRAALQPPR